MSLLRIEYEGTLVGHADPGPDGDRFSLTYHPDWLARRDAFAISVSLPLREETWPAASAHPWFANLLPEGVAREAIARRLGISPDNDVALLARLGDDTAGALRFRPADGEARPHRDRRLITVDEVARWALGEPALLSGDDEPPRLSLAGAQHKITVVRTDDGFAVPSSDEASTHILKFDSPRFVHLSVNELVMSRLGRELGLEVITARLSELTDIPFLVVDRYDRDTGAHPVRRLHQEDFCQVFGLPPTRKYEEEGGPTLAQIVERLREVSAQPAADILRLVRWVVFCAIGGNADGHAKNLSLLHSLRGPVLAPFYDLVCTRAYPRLDRRLAFSIGGERDPGQLTLARWRRFAEDIGVSSKLVLREVEAMVDAAPDAFERASEPLNRSTRGIPQIERVVRKHARAIRNRLGRGV